MSTHQTVRRWVMTGAVTAVTVAGTIYGAQLKGSQDASKERQRLLEATPEDRIAQLEVTRSELMTQKLAMERKIELFHERCAMRERDREEERLRQQRLQRIRENLK